MDTHAPRPAIALLPLLAGLLLACSDSTTAGSAGPDAGDTNPGGGASVCMADADCPSGRCDDGRCCEGDCAPAPGRDLGQACVEGAECGSGACSDGVCCEDACDGGCHACDVEGSKGRCVPIPPGLDPDGECAGDDGTCGGNCDGAGACLFPDEGLDCGTCASCDGAGACTPRPAGQDPLDDCGSCLTCDGAGACAAQAAGEDLHDDCAEEAPCGLSGTCDGAGACAHHAAGTPVTPVACAGGVDSVLMLADVCDGSGGVSDGGLQSCWPFSCEADACAASCTAGAGCAIDAFCDVGDVDGDGKSDECMGRLSDGSACSDDDRDGECAGGECAGGFCCGESGARCCGVANDCPAPSPPTCIDATTCDGQGSAVSCLEHTCAETTDPDDDSACEGLPCGAPSCDGLVLHAAAFCDLSGQCIPTSESCDDDDPCTIDACDPQLGCSHVPDAQLCDDEDPCTIDSCDRVLGCQFLPDDYQQCDDGNPCTETDFCLGGACGGDAVVCPDDGNPCTDSTCDFEQGCVHLANDGNSCDGGEFCTTYACSGGACVTGNRDCDDGLFCNGIESCDEDQDTCASPGACEDDGNPCNGVPSCDEDGDQCLPGAPPDCDDGEVCTVDACDPVDGCVYTPADCVDGLAHEILFANDASLSDNIFTFVSAYTTPAINAAGTVVILARDGDDNPIIVASEDGGGYRVVADIGDFNNTNWPAVPSINDAGQVAFVAVTIPGGVRVVRAETNGGFTTIAAWSDAVPAGGTFSNFNAGTGKTSPALTESGDVVFWASFLDGVTYNGIFSGNGLVNGIKRHTWDVPGTFYGRIDAVANLWAARKLTSPGSIITGLVDAVALGDTYATNSGWESGPDARWGITYVGTTSGAELGLVSSLGQIPGVAPSGGYSGIRHPDRESVDGAATIGFEATRTGGGRGVFVWTMGALSAVIEVGDALADGTVDEVRFYRGLNDTGQVTFWARLTDGREAIVRASPTCLGAPCDDGEVCTLDDRCDGSLCTGTAQQGCN